MRCPHTLVISSVQSGEREKCSPSTWRRVSRAQQLDLSTTEHELVDPATHLIGVFFWHASVIGSSDPWQALAWRSCVPVGRCCPLCLSNFPVVSSFLWCCARLRTLPGLPSHNVGEYFGGEGTGPSPRNVGVYLGGGGTRNVGVYLGGGGTGPPPHNSGEYVSTALCLARRMVRSGLFHLLGLCRRSIC